MDENDVPIVYKGQMLAAPRRLDFRVEKLVIVEVKATTAYNTVCEAQALTYLRLLDLRLALVINFGDFVPLRLCVKNLVTVLVTISRRLIGRMEFK